MNTTYNYVITIPNIARNVYLNITKYAPASRVEFDNSGTYVSTNLETTVGKVVSNLVAGVTKNLIIKVLAEDLTTFSTYQLSFIREKSSISTIKSFTLSHGKLTTSFDNSTAKNYTIQIPSVYNNITIIVIPNEEFVVMKLDGITTLVSAQPYTINSFNIQEPKILELKQLHKISQHKIHIILLDIGCLEMLIY